MTSSDAHARLMSIPAIQDQVLAILNGTQSTVAEVSATAQCPAAGTWVQVTVHSPVQLHAYDTQGRHTGPTGDLIETGIPGSKYYGVDGDSQLILPSGDTYQIVGIAIGQGTASFDVKSIGDSQAVPQAFYNDLSIGTATKAGLTLDDHLQPSSLSLDVDGDGVVDMNLPPTRLAMASLARRLVGAATQTMLVSAKAVVTATAIKGHVTASWEGNHSRFVVPRGAIATVDLHGTNVVQIAGVGRLRTTAANGSRSVELGVPFVMMITSGATDDEVSVSITPADSAAMVVEGTVRHGSVRVTLK
jgi:hypothetical protein